MDVSMNDVDKEYRRLVSLVLEQGQVKKNRTGIDTIGVFGEQSKFDINPDAFPILTTKKVFFKGIVHELLWFLSGNTNIKYLVDNDVHIWDEWAYGRYKKSGVYEDDECWNQDGQGIEVFDQKTFILHIKDDAAFARKWGELGQGTYGSMWRNFPYADYFQGADLSVELELRGVDQIQKVIDKLKTNPDDRRMIVSTWHPYWVDKCALPPCHCIFHFNTEELTMDERFLIYWKNGGKNGWVSVPEMNERTLNESNIPKRRLNCLLYQRSCDLGLGIPFNITSYCLLTAMLAHCVNMVPGTFTHTYGDLHIYNNHIESLREQIKRVGYTLPRLWINPSKRDLFAISYDDIKLEEYRSHPSIKMDIAV